MRIVLGVLYTPFIPGGEELKDGVEEAAKQLEGCVNVVDAATDALTLLDVTGGFDTLILVAPSPRLLGKKGVVERRELLLPTRVRDPFEVVEDIRASLEGSLDVDDLVKALDAMLAARGERARLIVYECSRGACRGALRRAIIEAARLAGCEVRGEEPGE